jgi:GTPase
MSELPIIAIVGRPNVGKSTLFNRLTNTRDALVSDLPGLTRDRREGVAVFGGHTIKLYDTAGLEEAKPGTIADRMRKQSETAIESADVILFVIDSRDGITGADEAFSKIVRAAGKPTVLVANKCEGRQGNDGFYEAFKLGLGDPVAISAEHGEGLADLEVDVLAALGLKGKALRKSKQQRRRDAYEDEDEVSEDAEADEAPRPAKPLRVAIVGRPNAGKSTLVNALVGEDRMITGPEPGLTRDSVSIDFISQGRKVRLFDTAGLRRKAKINELAEKLSASDAVRAIRFAEVVVLLVDAEHPLEHQDLTIGNMITEEGRAIVVAVNKWDLIEDKNKTLQDVKTLVEQSLAQVPGVPVVTVSALGERGLDPLMKAVMSASDTWNRRVSTADLNRWLQEALQRHSPPAVSGRRIKLKYITQTSARPPAFVAFCSRPEELPKSYIKYLSNSLRQTFNLPGVPIRISMRKQDNPFAGRAKRR